jgi:hypothetical protein
VSTLPVVVTSRDPLDRHPGPGLHAYSRPRPPSTGSSGQRPRRAFVPVSRVRRAAVVTAMKARLGRAGGRRGDLLGVVSRERGVQPDDGVEMDRAARLVLGDLGVATLTACLMAASLIPVRCGRWSRPGCAATAPERAHSTAPGPGSRSNRRTPAGRGCGSRPRGDGASRQPGGRAETTPWVTWPARQRVAGCGGVWTCLKPGAVKVTNSRGWTVTVSGMTPHSGAAIRCQASADRPRRRPGRRSPGVAARP